jgi:hypothetical protein
MYVGVVCFPTCKQMHVHVICTDMFCVVPVTCLLVSSTFCPKYKQCLQSVSHLRACSVVV